MEIENMINQETQKVSNDVAPIKEIIHENLQHLQQDPIGTIVPFFQTHMWILTIIAALFAASGVYNIYKMKAQKRNEMDIKNMFNADGSKNQHYTHKEYNPFPSFVFMILVILLELLLSMTTI